jgi:Fe-S oxidoreductase/coenzyme F420-reducing hydrogenase delta subunit
MRTKPEILAFLCNWCSYAGADLAGTSRISYPTNVRPIRVMCSGRVDPSFIFNAFKTGIDGVLVSGCHPGDCHYISGNLKAEKMVKNTKQVLKLLGLGSERLRLEWVSASEGQKFADIIKDFTAKLKRIGPNLLKTKIEEKTILTEREPISEIIEKTNVRQCLECGKCSSSCPITKMNPDFSPRMTVKRVLTEAEEVSVTDEGIWTCLTCGLCQERCPSNVQYVDFVRACRQEASQLGITGNCSHKDVLLDLQRIMTNPKINQNRLKWLPKGAKVSESGDTLYFVGCLPYFDVIFKDIKVKSLETAKSVVGILNKVGIEPVLLKNERCCGHDLYFTGDMEKFEKLAKLNVAAIREAKAKKVVASCAECYRTLKLDYPKVVGDLGFEVLHISEFLAELIESEKIEFPEASEDKKVTYHDPCRLGRQMGLYDPPRNVIKSIPEMDLLEMERNRENALCCGVSSWLNCGKLSKQIQLDRLKEAKATGAELLITACPKCQIHLKCAMDGELPVKRSDVDVKLYDLPVIVAKALGIK